MASCWQHPLPIHTPAQKGQTGETPALLPGMVGERDHLKAGAVTRAVIPLPCPRPRCPTYRALPTPSSWPSSHTAPVPLPWGSIPSRVQGLVWGLET